MVMRGITSIHRFRKQVPSGMNFYEMRKQMPCNVEPCKKTNLPEAIDQVKMEKASINCGLLRFHLIEFLYIFFN